jgi:hypothetical protein
MLDRVTTNNTAPLLIMNPPRRTTIGEMLANNRAEEDRVRDFEYEEESSEIRRFFEETAEARSDRRLAENLARVEQYNNRKESNVRQTLREQIKKELETDSTIQLSPSRKLDLD